MTRTALEMANAMDDENPFVTVITDPSCLRLITARSATAKGISAPYAVFFPTKRIVIKHCADPEIAAREIAADLERLSMRKAPLCVECGGVGSSKGAMCMGPCPDCGTTVCDLCIVKRAVECGRLSASIVCDVCDTISTLATRALGIGARGRHCGDVVWPILEQLAKSRGGAIVVAFDAAGRHGRACIDSETETVSMVDGEKDDLALVHLRNVMMNDLPARCAIFGEDWINVFDRKNITGAEVNENGENDGNDGNGGGDVCKCRCKCAGDDVKMQWFFAIGCNNFTRGLYGALELACRKRK